MMNALRYEGNNYSRSSRTFLSKLKIFYVWRMEAYGGYTTVINYNI